MCGRRNASETGGIWQSMCSIWQLSNGFVCVCHHHRTSRIFIAAVKRAPYESHGRALTERLHLVCTAKVFFCTGVVDYFCCEHLVDRPNSIAIEQIPRVHIFLLFVSFATFSISLRDKRKDITRFFSRKNGLDVGGRHFNRKIFNTLFFGGNKTKTHSKFIYFFLCVLHGR